MRVFLYSYEDVLGKIIFFFQYFTPYSLLFNKAIVQFFSSIIFSIPFIFIKFKDKVKQRKTLYEMIGDIFDDKINILLYFVFLIICFFYNILVWQIIDIFSPNHYCIAKVFEGFAVLIVNIIKDVNIFSGYFILRIIMYILLILISFIYNEFLIINICGLGEDTKKILDYMEEYDKFLVHQIEEENNIEIINQDLVDSECSNNIKPIEMNINN